MELPYWLVGIAGASALGSAWFFMRYVQMKEHNRALIRLYEQVNTEKTQATELLSLAQKEIGALSAHKETLGKTQEAMKLEFRNTANQLFEEVSQKFTLQSEKKIGDILLPLQSRIVEFQKNVDEKFGTQGKEHHTLKSEIEKIVLQTDSLTKALRGDVKAQGNWGEVMLERILEESGLTKGADYVTQAEAMGLKGVDGSILRPDVIVNLPGGQHVIVDAKVSLTAYERYCREESAAGKEAHLREFIRSIRTHVSGLSQKNYQHIEKLNAPDFVLLFLPVEGAYTLAVQNDPELLSYASGVKIVLASPSTLMATLKTVASMWRIEKQSRNVQEIARQAGALYDKFAGFVSDMEEIGRKIGSTQTAYDAALGKLSTGTGNLVGRVEKLKALGAKTTKSLPKELLQDTEEEVA